MNTPVPRLTLSDWQPTRDSLHRVARIIGTLRAKHAPVSKHWWHITLHVSARGLTTMPFPVAEQMLELSLDLVDHAVAVDSSDGWRQQIPLRGQTSASLCDALMRGLDEHKTKVATGMLAQVTDATPLPYDPEAAVRYRRAINSIAGVFAAFQGKLRQETSPIQLFPHHFDLAMNWFSGRLVPGVDPADEESADEQMNFGFSTGDEAIPDAYFYATAYPQPDGFTDLTLPDGAYWHTEGFTAAILPYAALVDSDRPADRLLEYLRTVQAHGARLMQ
jgi:hypothetical protein